jgi:hypothetical protein
MPGLRNIPADLPRRAPHTDPKATLIIRKADVRNIDTDETATAAPDTDATAIAAAADRARQSNERTRIAETMRRTFVRYALWEDTLGEVCRSGPTPLEKGPM